MESSSLNHIQIRTTIQSKYFGRNFIYRTSLGSTNTLAKEMIRSKRPLPLVIVAEEQTLGRGRMMRSWFSPRNKGIWMTVVFPHSAENMIFGHYNFLMSLVTASAIESMTDLNVTFKWPNDILISGKKVCGILSELVSQRDGSQVLITGAGINVNVGNDEFPEEFQNNATSLSIESGAIVDRQVLFLEIINTLNTLYSVWVQKGIEPLYHEWMQKCTTTGKNVAIKMEKQYISGIVEQINRDGSLLIRDKTGKICTIFAGDLEYIIHKKNDQSA